MREIKFRVWDERAKQYADTKKCVYIVGVLHNNKITLGFDSPKAEYSLGLVLEQFTGLLDKNGKEIYEGDILKTNQALVIHEVVFYQSSFTTIRRANEHGRELRQKVGEKFYGQDTYLDEPLDDLVGGSEIIGNIHDNPELLKGEK